MRKKSRETDPFSHPNPRGVYSRTHRQQTHFVLVQSVKEWKEPEVWQDSQKEEVGEDQDGVLPAPETHRAGLLWRAGTLPSTTVPEKMVHGTAVQSQSQKSMWSGLPWGREWPGVLIYQVANTHLQGEIHISWTNSLCFQFNFKNLTLPDRNVGPYSFLKQNEIKLIVYKIFIRPTLVFELYLLQALKGPLSAYFIID